MNTPTTNCRSCFPNGDQPQCRTFDTSIGAMRIFSDLFGNDRMPTMCQGSDQRYRVCHQPVVIVAVSPRLVRDRIAENAA
jgi:hypothetical protein